MVFLRVHGGIISRVREEEITVRSVTAASGKKALTESYRKIGGWKIP